MGSCEQQWCVTLLTSSLKSEFDNVLVCQSALPVERLEGLFNFKILNYEHNMPTLAEFLASIVALAARIVTIMAACNMALASYDGHMTVKIAYAVIAFAFAALPRYSQYSKQELISSFGTRKHINSSGDDGKIEASVNAANHVAVTIECIISVVILYILNYFGA